LAIADSAGTARAERDAITRILDRIAARRASAP
jgi:hypothetical protein